MKSFLVSVAGLALAGAVHAQDMPGMATPSPQPQPSGAATPPATAPDDMANMANMPGMSDGGGMSGALGSFYPMSREASGTSWQPDATPEGGVMTGSGDWMLMGHALINGVYDRQQGPRGGQKTFVSGMLMGMATRSFASGDALQLRVMLSPDPPMGPAGYPLLLASGETADGVHPLVDRQHPHDLFMELAGSYSHKLGAQDSVFIYAGLPGEPAFGPPAFMHRASIMDSPEAPISHHWLDSTHIIFGVVTAGFIHGNWKIEASRFHGREPDQHRWNIETGALDSTSVRLSWNPTVNLALQVSWADVKSPEQLEPTVNQSKLSASAIYAVPIGAEGSWSTTVAWGRRTSDHVSLNAYMIESAYKPNGVWTLFGRAEQTANNELLPVHPGPVYTVGKISLGAIHDWKVATHVKIGLGGLYAFNFIPGSLEPVYGGDPHGAMAFLRLKID